MRNAYSRKYFCFLDEKLNEKLTEYQKRKSLEELADLLEIMKAVVKTHSYTWDRLTALYREKWENAENLKSVFYLKKFMTTDEVT